MFLILILENRIHYRKTYWNYESSKIKSFLMFWQIIFLPMSAQNRFNVSCNISSISFFAFTFTKYEYTETTIYSFSFLARFICFLWNRRLDLCLCCRMFFFLLSFPNISKVSITDAMIFVSLLLIHGCDFSLNKPCSFFILTSFSAIFFSSHWWIHAGICRSPKCLCGVLQSKE